MTGLKTLIAKCTAFGATGVLLLMLLHNTIATSAPGETRDFEAVFTDVSGLRAGDDVRVAGVSVGRVEAIEVDGSHARVHFSLAASQPVTDTSGLVLRYQNLIGQRFIALVPGKTKGDTLGGGATIPIERTSPGFDLTALLNGFRPLFQVLDPADINSLSESVVKVLQGEGGTVSGLLQQTARLTDYLADRDKLFDQVARNLTPLLLEIADNGAAMQDSLQQLALLTTGLAEDRATLGTSLDGLAEAIGRTETMATELRPYLKDDLKLLALVTRMYAENSEAYGKSFGDFGAVLGALGRTTSYRSNVNALICSLTLTSGDAKVPVGTPLDKHSEVCR